MQVLYDNPNEDLFQRLLKIRKIEDNIENFLNPSFSNSWIDPYLLNDFDIAINRIQKAIKKDEKIVVLWDYDVDWITSSFLLFKFFTKFLNHKKISIRLPNRLTDWYWMKSHHLDEIKSVWADLVITVDNWITSIQEAEYAKKIWLDLIITDHHKALDDIPKAMAVVNPQISPDYWFKWIAWVWVAFKLASALISKNIKDPKKKQEVLNYLMPIVAIWTIADCVPLLSENRLMTKMWLDYINKKNWVPKSILNFINYLNIKNKIDTYHVWFMIAPRINAWWRMQSPYDSLNCLLTTWEKQIEYLKNLDKINDDRRKSQEEWYKEIDKKIDKDKMVLIAESNNIHEWIVWIAAGRITEKYNKPSVIISIKEEEWKAVASLRGPEYFSVIDMLNYAWEYLERFGGHKQAWWMTVKIENLEIVKKLFIEYWDKNITEEDLKKTIKIDTQIYANEIENNKIEEIEKLAPFGEWNPEPIFLMQDVIFNNVEKVWKNWNWHLKAYANIKWIQFPVMFWWKWNELDYIQLKHPSKLIGKIKKDNYSWWFFVDGSEVYTS